MERKFVKTVVKVNNVVVGKITSFSDKTALETVDVTGSEDVREGTEMIQRQNMPISLNQTISVAGIVKVDDAGQDLLEATAKAGGSITLERIYSDNTGNDYEGYFTNYENSGSIGDGVYKFTADFTATKDIPVV